MKKIFSCVLASLFMFALVSCSSVESEAKRYVKETFEAASTLNFKKVAEIEKESKAYYETLSEEDKEIFEKVTEEATAEYAEKMKDKVENVAKGFGDALNAIGDLNDNDNENEK